MGKINFINKVINLQIVVILISLGIYLGYQYEYLKYSETVLNTLLYSIAFQTIGIFFIVKTILKEKDSQ